MKNNAHYKTKKAGGHPGDRRQPGENSRHSRLGPQTILHRVFRIPSRLRFRLIIPALFALLAAAIPRAQAISPTPPSHPASHRSSHLLSEKKPDHTAPERLRAAARAQAQHEWSLAADHYEAFLRDFGEHPSAKPVRDAIRCHLLECQLRADDFSEALKTLDSLLTHPPKTTPQTGEIWQDLPLLKARLLLRLQNYSAARGCFEAWLSNPPASSSSPRPNISAAFFAQRDEALLGVTTCLLEEGQPAEAAAYIERHATQLVHPRSVHAARVLRIQCALATQNPYQAWKFLESCLESLHAQGFGPACDRLLWQTADALTQKTDAPSLHAALCCLKQLAPGHVPALSSPLSSANPELNPSTDPPARHPKNEWQRLLQMAAILENLNRPADCALVLECARAHAPEKTQRECVDLRRLHLLEKLKRWPELETAAHEMLLHAPAEARIPGILLLRATAEAEQQAFFKAFKTLDEIETLHANAPELPHARLLHAHTLLLDGQVPLALARLDQFDAVHRKHPLHHTALLLRIQALLNQKSYAICRKATEHFTKNYPRENHTASAWLHGALAASAQGDHTAAACDAQSCLENNPDPETAAHAFLLLGHSRAHLGDRSGALRAFDQILQNTPPAPSAIPDHAARETARLLRAAHNTEALRDFWQRLLHQRPRCGALSEITRWIVDDSRQQAPALDPRSLLWSALDLLQTVPRCEAVVPLFDLLAEQYHTRSAEPELAAALQRKLSGLSNTPAEALARIHALCARIRLQQTGEDNALLEEATTIALHNLDKTPANVLAVLAARSTQGESTPPPLALRLWVELLRWNPRAPEKDRAYYAIGSDAAKRGDLPAASEAFGRALRECPDSDLLPRIRLERARLCLEVNTPEEAEREVHAILAHPRAAASLKAEALVLLGEKHMRAPAPAKAIACFQRVYILYPACAEAVAAAYLRSGEAFEMLHDPEAARRTYSELLSHAHLRALPQSEHARKKLQNLKP